MSLFIDFKSKYVNKTEKNLFQKIIQEIKEKSKKKI